MPGQKMRKASVRRKLNPIGIEFKGKNVLLVDDSIVRGTTSQQIIQMARDAGANKVYFASAAPPVRYPNVYGIDMPAAEELIAHNRSESEIARIIGADWLIYQDLDDLIDAVQKGNRAITEFDCSCFNGKYVTRTIDSDYLDRVRSIRSDSVKDNGDESLNVVGMDLHNNI
jgi:amidophosphoribosyltransferase